MKQLDLSDIDLCKQLATLCHPVSQLLQDHIAEYDSILPYLFMWELYNAILSDRLRGTQIIHFLDRAFVTCGDNVRNLIAVGFVESIEDESQFRTVFADCQCDALRQEWYRQRTIR